MKVNKKYIIKYKTPMEQIFKIYQCANTEKSLITLLESLNNEAEENNTVYQIEIKVIERNKKYEKLSINFTN